MKSITTHIKETLGLLYPPEEVRCFVRLILSHVCGLSYNQQILCKDKQIPEKEKEEIYAIVSRLKKMEPIQYILGETEFYSLPIKVNPSVLIPRPETEELVYIIIKNVTSAYNNKMSDRAENRQPIQILDIGTGSGCIAIALAKHIPDAVVTAIDISETALQKAKENALLNNVDICFLKVDILNILKAKELINGSFDIIVSNPPYIKDEEKRFMSANVIDYEPHQALFVSDEDPLLFYKAIAEFAKQKLTPEGMIYFEINPTCDMMIIEMLSEKGFAYSEIISDLSGKNRFISAKKICEANA